MRQPLPAHLETERVVLEPVEVQQQPAGWRKLGEEVTEELDWKPAKFIKRLYIRPKYANAERIVIAPLPARLIEKGLPGAGLLTQVIVGKYEDHLPLYRQEKIYRERHGVNLSRQTLCGWVEAAADWLVADLPGDESGAGGPGLFAGRRNADPLSGSGCERQKPVRLVVDLQCSRRATWCSSGTSAARGKGRASS